MPREDFIDAPSGGMAAITTSDAAPATRRPFHGGWALMVAAGLIAAVANYAVLTADAPTSAVAVLTARAPAGTPAESLQIRSLHVGLDDPAAHLLPPPDQVRALAGTVTATALEAGSVLRTTDLREPPGQGQGAMGLPVDPSRAAGGLLQPGDRVDVIAAEPAAHLGGAAAAASDAGGAAVAVGYVLRDVEVLAVSSPGAGVGAVGGSYSLTLSVDGEQALALARAVRTGDVDVVRAAGAPVQEGSS